MEKLPVEILTKIIDLLNPREQVQLQLVSRHFFTLARNNKLWRLHCYENSWSGLRSSSSAFWRTSRNPESSRALNGPRVRQLSQEIVASLSAGEGNHGKPATNVDIKEPSIGQRSRAAAEWDPSFETEDVDWYSEYIARHAPISFSWLRSPRRSARETSTPPESRDIKGIGLLRDWSSAREDKVIAPLEDGTVCIWDFNYSHSNVSSSRKGHVAGLSSPGVLFTPLSKRGEKSMEFLNVGECVSVDSIRRRAYIAVGKVLNEVDLETLRVISQQRYAWSVFALSQETDYSVPLTLATTLSLEIYDSRLSTPDEEAEISLRCEREPFTSQYTSDLVRHPESPVIQLQPNGLPPHRIRSPDPSEKGAKYASLFQPGPLSILHPPTPHVNSILLAGRFPSILCYDRRFFPQLQNAVHSGGGLCGLASIPAPSFPLSSNSHWPSKHTIAACGEYNGKGSLELYDLTFPGSSLEDEQSRSSSTMSVVQQNRQSAAQSKLLSVASHGARIVFSDGNGNIKWIERDGRAEVRRWNINTDRKLSTSKQPDGSSITADGQARHSSIFGSSNPVNGEHHGTHGNDVARKILPTDATLAGDELLLWTGDRIGRLRFSNQSDPSEPEEEEIFDDENDADGDVVMDDEAQHRRRERLREEQRRRNEYAGAMRRALEMEAEGVRWMGQLGMH